MKVAVTIILAATAIVQRAAAGHHSDSYSVVTRPVAVEEFDKHLKCPHGFQQHGKVCSSTLTSNPTVHCPIGFNRFVDDEHKCAKFYDKEVQCPPEFSLEKGACIRTHHADPLVQCPEGFTMMSNNMECSRPVPLPMKFFCPSETTQHGQHCVKRYEVAPEYSCPHRYTYDHQKSCKIVEEFDCTPEKVHYEDHHSHGHKKLRLLGEKKHSVAVYNKDSHPVESERVLQKTCQRVRIESARKVCPEGSHHHDKQCIAEEFLPLQEKHGGFREDVVRASLHCPHGHGSSSEYGYFKCFQKEEIPVHAFCPKWTETVGHKCAKFAPLILRCPSEYRLDNEVCLKKIEAAPLVEYNVHYQCSGKDCDRSPAASSHKKHNH